MEPGIYELTKPGWIGKRVRVTVRADGTTVIEPIGFRGRACLKATAELERALGVDASTRKLKPEYAASESAGITAKAGQ